MSLKLLIRFRDLDMKKVYVALIADLIHAGHVRLLKEAAGLGDVTVGLLTSKAVEEMNDRAFLNYEKRHEALNALKYISHIVPQDSASYKDNILKLKPDYVVHGDDWQKGVQKYLRDEVMTLVHSYGGSLKEIPYSSDISDSNVKNELIDLGIASVSRQSRLRELIKIKPVLRILEAHNPLSGLIAESTVMERNGVLVSFDGMWSSSLTDSTAKGKPDIEAVDVTSRLNGINDIFEVTTKPLIYDADTGGKIEHFEFTVKSLERTGVSAVIIEDKTGLKKNSLFGTDVAQTQDSIENFCKKLSAGKAAQLGKDFMIIARIESLILDAGMADALERAAAYIKAGADGIMIHSRQKDPAEVIEFVTKFRSADPETPLVVVPTSFNSVTVEEFEEMGVNIVITANHMLRAAYPAMLKVAKSILANGRTLEAEPDCMPVKDILEFIPGTK